MSARMRYTLLIGIPLIMQAFILYHALHYGSLIGPVQWDDVAYLTTGVINLDKFAQAQSIYDIAHHIGRGLDIRVPLAELQTLIGLLISGGEVWGPYALNVLTLLLVLHVVAFKTTKSSTPLFLAVLAFILTLPVTINSLIFLKSDWKGGLLIAAAMFVLNTAAERNDSRLKLLGAGILGFALASKLTAFYLPVLAVALLALYEGYGFVLARSSLSPGGGLVADGVAWSRQQWRTWLGCLALTLLPYCLFFASNAASNIRYIRQALTSVWFDNLTRLERAAFYSPFSADGAAAWGMLPVLLLLFAGGAAFIALRQRRYRDLLPMAIIGIAMAMFVAPLILAKTSNITFGSTLYGVAIGGTLVVMHQFVRGSGRWGGAIALAITLVVALPGSVPLSNSAYGLHVQRIPNAELRALKSTYGQIARAIGESSTGRPNVLVYYDHLYAPDRNLTILHFQQTGRILDTAVAEDLQDITRLRTQLEQTHFALTLHLDNGPAELPYGNGTDSPLRVDAKVDAAVAQQAGFVRVSAWPVRGGEIRLYRNSALQNEGTQGDRL